MDGSSVLLSVEAEAYVQALELYSIDQLGSAKWSQQHSRLEKLNMQAVLSASINEEEFVKEYLVQYEKLPLLVNQLIITELWKDKVFSALLDSDFEPKTTFQLYMVLYQEATLANLLETALYHRDAAEAADEATLELVDYCHRKLLRLVTGDGVDSEGKDATTELSEIATADTMDNLEKQKEALEFEICLKSVSIVRYLIDHLRSLPLSVETRLLNTLDIPVVLVQLVENPPWVRVRKGKTEKFIDGKWRELSEADSVKISKLEGQVWLALYQLLMDGENRQKYEINQYRKNVIIKLRAFLTEVLLDQLPVLGEMQRFLEQISMWDPPQPKKAFVLEQVPELRDSMLKKYEGRWSKMAELQAQKYFSASEKDLRAQAKSWADAYNMDLMSELLADPPKCAQCGAAATKRCSRCQTEWYCRRECQVQRWAKHKDVCNTVVEANKKVAETAAA